MPLILPPLPNPWAAGQSVQVRGAPVTLPAGRLITDFTSFVLCIREDPLWPRAGGDIGDPDPVGDGWAAVVTATGSLDGSTPVFNFTVPATAGDRRFSYDVWGFIGSNGIQLAPARWLTVSGRVVSA